MANIVATEQAETAPRRGAAVGWRAGRPRFAPPPPRRVRLVICRLLAGAALGLIGAYFGGKTDLALERVMDVMISFPVIILAVAVVAALGTGTVNVIVAITIPIIPRVARVIRASGLTLREMQYIEAARCLG